MKLSRFLTGLAPALAIAALIGFSGLSPSRADDAPAAAPAAAAPAAPAAAAPAAAPADAAAAPAAAAPAAPPACSATVTDKCTGNSGDTAWMLTSVALVLMMTIPGLGLFYGGMVRKKNVGDTVMTSFAITCLVTVIYALVTYSL
jgi:ammonium transporter, Amt family